MFITDGFTFDRKEEITGSQNPEQNPIEIFPDAYLIFKISLDSESSSLPKTITFNPDIKFSYPQGFGPEHYPDTATEQAIAMMLYKLGVIHLFEYSHP